MTDWPNNITVLQSGMKESEKTSAGSQSSVQLTGLLQGWNQLLPGRLPQKVPFTIFKITIESIIPSSSKLLLPIRPTKVWNLCPGIKINLLKCHFILSKNLELTFVQKSNRIIILTFTCFLCFCCLEERTQIRPEGSSFKHTYSINDCEMHSNTSAEVFLSHESEILAWSWFSGHSQ